VRTSIAITLLFAAFSSVADASRSKAIHDATVLVDQGKADRAIAATRS
jgi:hypothetical protein